MTFGKKRKSLGHNKSGVDDYELVRYCNILNHNIVGGFSKLLNFFIKTHSPRVIETYADIRWSGLNPISTVYSKNGFVFKKQPKIIVTLKMVIHYTEVIDLHSEKMS